MNLFLVLVFIVLSIAAIFVLTHLRPLTDQEINALGNKRRNYQTRNYFVYDGIEKQANIEFKKNMDSKGNFYTIDETLYRFPSLVASLLKYKKHEWIIIGFEKERNVDLIWLNKGYNRESVSSYLGVDHLIRIAKADQYKSILIFHNHPNSNPNYYSLRKPSKQDIVSAEYYKDELNSEGINLIEFVCERGKFYEYFFSTADTFFPLTGFVSKLHEVNGKTRLKNLTLHIERCFS